MNLANPDIKFKPMFLVEFSAITSSVSIFYLLHMTYPRCAECMEYLPTFFHKTKPNVDKHAIHSAHLVYVFLIRCFHLQLGPKGRTPVETCWHVKINTYFHGLISSEKPLFKGLISTNFLRKMMVITQFRNYHGNPKPSKTFLFRGYKL